MSQRGNATQWTKKTQPQLAQTGITPKTTFTSNTTDGIVIYAKYVLLEGHWSLINVVETGIVYRNVRTRQTKQVMTFARNIPFVMLEKILPRKVGSASLEKIRNHEPMELPGEGLDRVTLPWLHLHLV